MASDIYLKIEGIEGEATDSKHPGWIELQSFSWGATQSASPSASGAGGHASGRADISDFNVMKFADKASPTLFSKCTTGTHIKSATVEVCRATGDGGQQPYMQYKFEDIIVSSFQNAGSGGGGLPSESLSLKFAKVMYDYVAVDNKGKSQGKVAAGWDLAANKKI